VRADGYWTQSNWASLYVRGRVSGGWNTDRPFQLRLGGRESIRAYSEDAFPGGRLLFGSVEQRFTVEALSPSFADVGLAAFADAGRMWAGDAPFGRDSGWQAGVGAGLRISPAGGRRVFRADVMLPLTDLRDERGVALRLYGEIFGVLERRRWPDQVERSRWYGNHPDLSRRIADPLAGN
ncbi:MAG: BamA/TamA family outer membrane protein, partial [Gemmatimonadetes bacterium]|nr:outer membrane protein assembly factor [Gemmatimonadota bacterium]NNL29955.1 BamA/TamA family outer membrane protein [Gemmatimonadota bacterium]